MPRHIRLTRPQILQRLAELQKYKIELWAQRAAGLRLFGRQHFEKTRREFMDDYESAMAEYTLLKNLLGE